MKIPPAVAARLLFAGKALVLTSLLAVSAVLVLRAQQHVQVDKQVQVYVLEVHSALG